MGEEKQEKKGGVRCARTEVKKSKKFKTGSRSADGRKWGRVGELDATEVMQRGGEVR